MNIYRSSDLSNLKGSPERVTKTISAPRRGAIEIPKHRKVRRELTKEETGVTEEKKVEETIKYSATRMRAEYDAMTELLEARDKEITDLKLALAKMKDEFEAQNKSKLIDELRKVTNYGIEYLSACDVSRLEQLIEDYENAKRPRFRSSGDLGGQTDPYAKLHNMYKFGRKG